MDRAILVGLIVIFFSCAGNKRLYESYQRSEYETAIAACQQAIARDSTNGEAYWIMGKCYRALGQDEVASSAFTKAMAVSANPKFTILAKQELIAIKLDEAQRLLGEKSYSSAIAHYLQVLELDSTNVDAYRHLGECYEQNGFLDRAKYYYEQANRFSSEKAIIMEKILAIDSLSLVADRYFQQGKKHYNAKNDVAAVKNFKQALAAKADHRDAKYYFHIAQGNIFYRRGRLSDCWDAIEHYGKAMSIRPESAEPHFLMAQAYERKDRNEFHNAIEEYRLALDLEPNGPYSAKCKTKIKELTERWEKMKKFWGK